MSRCTINAYFIILRISGLSLHTVRINPRKNRAPVFLIANHQQFCNIFSTNYWVGYFSPSLLLVQVFFFSELPCRNFFFKIISNQKLDGQPLNRQNNAAKLHTYHSKGNLLFINIYLLIYYKYRHINVNCETTRLNC